MANEADHDELVRVRQRVHAMRSTLAALAFRVRTLEEWRGDHTREADAAFAKLQELVQQDETAKAIAFALRHRGRVELTWVQRASALVIFVLTLFDFLDRLTHGHL